ncbi:pyruvate:ferredoxin (flavodoxin) oxidoreductase [Kiritimatiellota bacterium B12222]|nr:pyruvate:ferredoxin (flavodoxin) oxidoreductase [Kiritimatiellota bacterium B12222]
MKTHKISIDGNEAAASIAHRCNEVCAIYPITPSSTMGELADEWSSQEKTNIWGTIPDVVELQSEGGASGSVHGALQTGALTATFTASQGLLLMLPNMYKIAGELLPTVFHVTARSLAAQALSIFGDHSDVMSARTTGWSMLCSSSVQEAHDLALISQASTLKARIPIMHFFDGFRTSHEIQKIEYIPDDVVKAMIDDELVFAHRARALSPDAPVIRGTAQNPDVYFQGRETVNPFYTAMPDIVQAYMDRFAELTGRAYHLFEYAGADDAERVIVLLGSGADTVRETVAYLRSQGEKVGMIQIHLFRPFSSAHFLAALPKAVKSIAVLDRTKEPGGAGEPVYQDVLTVLGEALMEGELPLASMPRVIGGRYGLSSKEFTPAMVKAVFDELMKAKPKNHFTLGINDDVGHTSLDYDPSFITEKNDTTRAMFFGLGSDGTVGANKNTIKIIGGETDLYTQGYFVYDSKKAGSRTVSHLRFGPEPIRSSYLVQSANFIGCHQFNFLDKTDVLKHAAPGGTFLLNTSYSPETVWEHLPRCVQEQITVKQLKFYIIDGYLVAKESGMGTRINTVMQTCFFAISGVLPREEAIDKIKQAIQKTYGKKGQAIVEKNFAAVDHSLAHLQQVQIPLDINGHELPSVVSDEAPDFVKDVTATLLADRGDDLPVSKMSVDGTFPVGTTKWEKRNIALQVPVWDPEVCTQCGMCSMVCPHGVIRSRTYDASRLADAPETFKAAKARGAGLPEERRFTMQLSFEDCTGCGVCVEVCPAKNRSQVGLKALNMTDKDPLIQDNREEWNFFHTIPENDRSALNFNMPRDVQFIDPLFEFSGACVGCGETPYIKAMTQLFGDRSLIANATGCSSIYGGNLPTTPYTTDKNGRGPAWCNSLFEDNAEFGLGYRLTIDRQKQFASELLHKLRPELGDVFVDEVLQAGRETEAQLIEQRNRIALLKEKLAYIETPDARQLETLADMLVHRSVWIIGGDGWAYDIGYGGLDHVLASGRNVNVLVLDTEVYSNTGGQMSKSTPIGAVAKFAAAGKTQGKKDLGMIAASYGNIYVARVAMGAVPRQTLRAFVEAESYDGPSLIIAYSHCIAHGIDMKGGLRQQKLAVDSGHYPLFRYDPRLANTDQNPFQLDCRPPSIPLKEYAYNELRYRMMSLRDPERASQLLKEGQAYINDRWKLYERMAEGV